MEEGPVGWLEGLCQWGHIGDRAEAVCEASDEEDCVRFGGVGGEFECG